jgi:hypothetical protein
MQAALFFGLIFPPPAAGPKILSFGYSPGARRAAYAWKTPVVKDIIRNVVLLDEIFYIVQRPMKNRVELD